MTAPRKRSAPRSLERSQGAENQTNTVSKDYSAEVSSVNSATCWWCRYFAATADSRRRKRMFCRLDGEPVRPEALCHVAGAGGVPC